MKTSTIKKKVREAYARAARKDLSCCEPKSQSACCGDTSTYSAVSKTMGYSDSELKSVPQGSNLGLGCGNPVAIATLKEGETVLDLGSGAGFDCFLAANKVGPQGKVIGVDMTPEMIDKARSNAEKGKYQNVEFRLGEIEHLPVVDNSVDVIISNCVVNLAPDKEKVMQEAYRVLKTGGRISVSDLALTKELPEKIRKSIKAYVGCIGGAILLEDYKKAIAKAGFKDIKVTFRKESDCNDDPEAREALDQIKQKLSPEEKSLSDYVVSAYFEATK